MNSPSKREKFEAMLAEDPQDQFLRYALALELKKEQKTFVMTDTGREWVHKLLSIPVPGEETNAVTRHHRKVENE